MCIYIQLTTKLDKNVRLITTKQMIVKTYSKRDLVIYSFAFFLLSAAFNLDLILLNLRLSLNSAIHLCCFIYFTLIDNYYFIFTFSRIGNGVRRLVNFQLVSINAIGLGAGFY